MKAGAWIRNRRTELGLTQPEVAAAVGITQPHLSRIERGVDTRLSTLLRIAEVLRCHPAELLGGLAPEALASNRLVRQLSAALDTRFAFLSAFADPRGRSVRLLSFWRGSYYGEASEYPIAGTPCEHVVGNGVAFFPSGVRELFPDDGRLHEVDVESYLGASLANEAGNAVGTIGVMHTSPLQLGPHTESILRIFAVSGAAIVQRHWASEALGHSETRYRDLIKDGPAVVYRREFLPKPLTLVLSSSVEELTGYPLARFLSDGHSWDGLIHPEDRARVLAEVGEAIENVSEFRSKYRLRHKDGSERLVLDIARLGTGLGVPRSLHGIVVDITEREGLEEELHGSLGGGAIGRAGAGVGHGFNNVLTAILGGS